jgi:RNA polymerase sigma-70 factor (ECF subfamily)
VDLEERILGFRERGDLDGAATCALEGYGSELFGFLVALLRREEDASEVFSQTCEDLWVGLARFECRSSMRTWLYALARHAAARFRRSPHRRPGRHVGLSGLRDVAECVRTATLRHMQTDVKDRFAALRDSLPDDDRTVLVLRLDRGMGWSEIARVFRPGDESDEGLAREAARLRKRFQLLKVDIRARARRAGLVPDADAKGANRANARTRRSGEPEGAGLKSSASDSRPVRG